MHTKLKLLSLSSLLALSHFAQADWVDDAVLANDAHVIQLREHIHQHPELATSNLKPPNWCKKSSSLMV